MSIRFILTCPQRYSPAAREINTFLAEYNLSPPPTIFEIDERGACASRPCVFNPPLTYSLPKADEAVLTPLLYRLTISSDFPILLIAGKPVESIDTIRNLNATGQLRTMIAASGAVIDGGKRFKKGKRRAPA